MAGSPDEGPDELLRFGPGFRVVHWAHAIPFLLLLLTGLTLFVPTVKAVHLGGYRLLPLLHVLLGIAFILSPLPLYLRLRKDAAAAGDLRGLFALEPGDRAWARYAFAAALGARVRMPPVGKFNFGQKANTVFTVAVTAGLMLTGAVLAVNFFTKSIFSAAFVEQIFPLHDLLMLVALPVVAVHIYLGSLHPGTRESFRAITGGSVRRTWARAHHSRWAEEIDRNG